VTADEKRRALADYRIRQAEESLDEARFLLDGGKSLRAVINRAYYAMFYAVLRLLIFEEYASSKHSGVIAYFNKTYIKPGRFPADPGIYFNKAFELRQRGDYREYAELTREIVIPYLEKASEFIKITGRLLQNC
jgi:uncharacterized protein